MGFLGTLAFLAAFGGAGWLLWRNATGKGMSARNVTLFKGVVWLGLAAALFVAKLLPLAFMLLLAAGGVTAIEMWRERAMKEDEARSGGAMTAPAKTALSKSEAASVLGVDETADSDAVKSAHKKLIAQLHPDKGGTDYLAAKINEAREVMLRK